MCVCVCVLRQGSLCPDDFSETMKCYILVADPANQKDGSQRYDLAENEVWQPWKVSTDLGTITCLAVGDARNCGTLLLVYVSSMLCPVAFDRF